MKPNLYKRGATWWACFTDATGKRRRVSTKMTTPAAAQAVLAELVATAEKVRAGILPPQPRSAESIPQLVRMWERDTVARGRSAAYAEQAAGTVAKACERMGWVALAHLTPNAAAAFQDTLGHVSAGSAAVYCAHVKAWFSWLHRTGRLAHDPGVGFGKINTAGAKRRRALTTDEVRRLLNCPAIPESCRRAYTVLVYTGLRADKELGRLVWPNVEGGVLRVQGKGGLWRSVPINDIAARALAEQRRAHPMGLVVFPDLPGPKDFAKHLELAGIARVDERGWKATRHSLRHTWVTWLYESGVADADRAALAGHSESISRAVYTHVAAQRLAEAVNRLPRVG